MAVGDPQTGRRDELRSRLRAELGDAVSYDPGQLRAVQTDESGQWSEGEPLAIVRATSVESVQSTMRFASRERIPVVPRGAGTGLAGGGAGTDLSIVLSLSPMDRILEVDAANQLAVVQPGVLNQNLNDALAPHGLRFAPDPASKAISTVGGNIATNAGGLICAKYGVTREAVLGVKVVLADGRLVSFGHRTVKGVTGYDVTALFVGSEGTLGVVVEATVRAIPVPEGDTVTIGAIFPDIVSAARACAAVTAARLRPAVMELMDGPSLAAIRSYLGEEYVRDAVGTVAGDSYLLIQTDGLGSHDEARRALAIVTEHGGVGRLSADDEVGERLLAIRRSAHHASVALGDVLIEDVSVPRSRMPEMFDAIRGIAERHDVSIPTVAHAGDGNLHPNFVFERGPVPERVWQAAGELFATALELGGTLTGEHGVGVLKQRWLRQELGDDSYALQRDIKRVFDPLGILNPGKIFSDHSA